MLVIRYLRTGRKNQPFFKIVVTDKRNAPRGGRFVEILGFYDPLTKKKNLKKERVQYWLSKGAKPSVSAHNLLVEEKIIEAKKIATHAKKKLKEGEKTVVPATPVTPPTEAEKPEEKKVETPALSSAPQTPASAAEAIAPTIIEVPKNTEAKKEVIKTEKPQEIAKNIDNP